MKKYLLLFTAALMLTSCSGQSQTKVENIAPPDFAAKLKSSENAQLIDVRTPSEYASQHIENSTNIDWNGENFEAEAMKLDKAKPVFVYCKVGGRSAQAADKLQQMGFSKIYNLDGGILKWNSAGLADSGKAVGMTMVDYQKLIAGKKVLINFSAEWCAPCKKMKPYLTKMKAELKENVTIVQLDADANKTLMEELKLDELPALLLYENDKLTWKQTGFVSEENLKKQLQ